MAKHIRFYDISQNVGLVADGKILVNVSFSGFTKRNKRGFIIT